MTDVTLLPVSISQISRRSEASVREKELWTKSLTNIPHTSADLEDLHLASDALEEEKPS